MFDAFIWYVGVSQNTWSGPKSKLHTISQFVVPVPPVCVKVTVPGWPLKFVIKTI